MQDRLFARAAGSFVELYRAVPAPYRDAFFAPDGYPNLTAQAAYCAFSNIFPDSARNLGVPFKNWLVEITSEWMTGITPLPGSWRGWNLARLEFGAEKVRRANCFQDDFWK